MERRSEAPAPADGQVVNGIAAEDLADIEVRASAVQTEVLRVVRKVEIRSGADCLVRRVVDRLLEGVVKRVLQKVAVVAPDLQLERVVPGARDRRAETRDTFFRPNPQFDVEVRETGGIGTRQR